MSFVQQSTLILQSAYLQSGRETTSPQSTERIAGGSKALLQAVWWISRNWVERVAVSDPHRVSLIDLGLLIDDLVRAGDYSSAAMTDVQDLLCNACRRLNAAPGQCDGQSLHGCLLLREMNH
jgi:hypothetical protein